MKKTITVIAFSFLTISVIAQKGEWFVGGQFGIGGSNHKTIGNTTSTQITKTFSWNVSPEIGTFITDRIQLGLALTTGGSKAPALVGFGDRNYSSYGARLYSRHFWGKEQFKPFAGIEVSFIKDNTNSINPPYTLKTWINNTIAVANFGFSYSLSSRVSVLGEFGVLGYTHSVTSPNPENERSVSNSFGLNLGSNGNRFNIGFYYTFKK